MIRGLLLLIVALVISPTAWADTPTHAIAMHGLPKHAADMGHFPFVNPAAPKGGRVTLAQVANFDSLNPLTFRGESASGVREYVYESLLARSADEPFSLYGLIAEKVEVPNDRRSITFDLRREARFADGTPITTQDVMFTYEVLKEKGWPTQRATLRRVASVDVEGAHRIRFTFLPAADGSYDREMPLLLGLMAIMPKHKVDPAAFDQTTLEPPLGSGPYRITRVEPGRLLVFTKNPDWWARDLPIMRGRHNVGEIHIEFFRDETAMFEAFKAGQIDVHVESDPVRWATGYRFAALDEGRILKREVETRLPAGYAGLVFNTRRDLFQDVRVRLALIHLFDFEWINRNLYGGLYRRTHSVFERSVLSSFDRAADARETALLAPFQDAMLASILDGSYRLPTSDGSGNNRANQQAALKLLAEAGYRLEGRQLTDPRTKAQVSFDVLANRRSQERLLIAYQRALEQIGIRMTLRIVDSAQYEARLKDMDFDMVQTVWASSLSPGNEQANRWGSRAADTPNSRNYAGVRSPAADAMIGALVAAREADEFVAAARAFDRVIRSGHYVVPLFHVPSVWLAHSARLAGPPPATNGGFDLDTWWIKP